MNTGIYIDDTGTSGLTSASKYSSPNAKSWYAVILKPSDRVIANDFIHNCLKDLKNDYNANEFHFKDVYNGKNEFKDIPLNVRLNIISEFAELFCKYQFPILCQTFSPEDYERNNLIKGSKTQTVDSFNLNNYSDFSLYHLLMLVKKYTSDITVYPRPFEIVIDQDGKKVDTTRTVSLFNDDLLHCQLLYKSSKDEPLIQLADFAAYCLNRQKWIIQNNTQNTSDIDMTFVQICSNARFNTLNMHRELNQLGTDLREKFDEKLRDSYDKSGRLPNIDIQKYKEELTQKKK